MKYTLLHRLTSTNSKQNYCIIPGIFLQESCDNVFIGTSSFEFSITCACQLFLEMWWETHGIHWTAVPGTILRRGSGFWEVGGTLRLKSSSQCSGLSGPNTKMVYFLDNKVTWEGPTLTKNITGSALLDGSEKWMISEGQSLEEHYYIWQGKSDFDTRKNKGLNP